MLSYKTVEPHTLELIKELMGNNLFNQLRLVGGTALALQYGHRSSVDIDFFGKINADNETIRRQLSKIGVLSIIKESENIKVYTLDNIKIDIVNYSYKWIDDAITENKVRLASPKDIAAMKINAIEGRGSKKDFIDVFCLLHHYSLNEILQYYSHKYPEHSFFRALMSLSFFDDADEQPMPVMFIKDTWNEMKKFISKAVTDYSNL